MSQFKMYSGTASAESSPQMLDTILTSFAVASRYSFNGSLRSILMSTLKNPEVLRCSQFE